MPRFMATLSLLVVLVFLSLGPALRTPALAESYKIINNSGVRLAVWSGFWNGTDFKANRKLSQYYLDAGQTKVEGYGDDYFLYGLKILNMLKTSEHYREIFAGEPGAGVWTFVINPGVQVEKTYQK